LWRAPGDEYHGEGAFFKDANDTILYSMSGFNDPSTPTNTLLAFNTITTSWTNVTVSGGNFNFDARTAALHANSMEEGTAGLGFIIGGYEDIPGMVRFNGSDPDNLHWTNETQNNPPLTLNGGMEYTRYGKQGSLITFGGYGLVEGVCTCIC
jgi:hypothetical protein